MANEHITQQLLHQLLIYNDKTGLFYWRSSGKGRRSGVNSVAGCRDSEGYIQITINSRQYRAHRLAWLYVYGQLPTKSLDHIDQNRANNAISNLRDVSNSLNLLNSKIPKDNTSGVKGVTYQKRDRLWVAWFRGQYLGSSSNKDEAIRLRRTAETSYV